MWNRVREVERRMIWPVAAAMAAWSCGPALAQPAGGLVGHWTFDEGAGASVADSSPNSNHGTLYNGVGAWTAGKHGGGLRFDGTSNTEVRIPNSPSLTTFTGMTIAAWVYSLDVTRDAPIVAKEGPGLQSFWFGAIGGQFGLLLSPNGTSWPTLEPSRRKGGVPQAKWTHLATTWDGATMRMYENGILVGSHAYSSPIAGTSAYTSIGMNSMAANRRFFGVIDDVFIYNRALTAAEVGSVMGEPQCTEVFADSFAPASSRWSNSSGNWTSSAGQYYPLNPTNTPPTYSGLPFIVGDFELSVRVNNLTDGGIWLRTDGTNQNGLLLVTGGNGYGQGRRAPDAGSTFYFHRVINGGYSAPAGYTGIVVSPGSTHDLRIAAVGTSYSVFLDGSISPITVVLDGTFPQGRVGLYGDQPNIPGGGSGPPQTFSNFVLTTSGPVIDQPPNTGHQCPGGSAGFAVSTAGIGPFTYQWQIESAPGLWIDLTVAPQALACGGTASASAPTGAATAIAVDPCPEVLGYQVRCIVRNACGSQAIATAPLVVSTSDFNQDGNSDQDDVTYLINVVSGGENPTGIDPDFNQDGNADQDDVVALINSVGGGGCP